MLFRPIGLCLVNLIQENFKLKFTFFSQVTILNLIKQIKKELRSGRNLKVEGEKKGVTKIMQPLLRAMS